MDKNKQYRGVVMSLSGDTLFLSVEFAHSIILNIQSYTDVLSSSSLKIFPNEIGTKIYWLHSSWKY